METIGERLRLARNRAVLTQHELKERSGVPVVTISRIESGWQQGQPYPSTVRKLATALGVAPRWLLLGEDAPADS